MTVAFDRSIPLSLFYFSFLSTLIFSGKQNTMLFNVSNASVFKKEGGVEKEVKFENCEHQLSFILKVGKNEIWRMEITPPNYSPFSFFRFFHIHSAVLQTRSPSFVFPPSWPPTARGFSFSSCFISFLKWRGNRWRKPLSFSFSPSFSFWRKRRKGIGGKDGLIFILFSSFWAEGKMEKK